ncbi:hypothetical protein KR222_010581, partial [Zaprionus bogoriensis]
LKIKLLSKFSETADTKLQRLLLGVETSATKPSEILANMRRLVPDKGYDLLLRSLFLQQMPQSIRPLLALWDDYDLDKLAENADKMLDAVKPSTQFGVEAVSRSPLPTDISSTIQELADSVNKLQLEVKNLKNPPKSKSRS